MRPYVPCRTELKRLHSRRHILAGAALLIKTSLSSVGCSQEAGAHQKVCNAGPYSFSDKLGGFITSTAYQVTVQGEDSLVIEEELQSSTSANLTI